MADKIPCKGTCKKQEFEVRNFKLTSLSAIARNPPGAPTADEVIKQQAVKDAVKKMEETVKEPEWEQACPGFSCTCVTDNSVKWSDWVEATAYAYIKFDVGTYSLSCAYEVRSRIVSGICIRTSSDSPATFTGTFVKDEPKPKKVAPKSNVEPKKKRSSS